MQGQALAKNHPSSSPQEGWAGGKPERRGLPPSEGENKKLPLLTSNNQLLIPNNQSFIVNR